MVKQHFGWAPQEGVRHFDEWPRPLAQAPVRVVMETITLFTWSLGLNVPCTVDLVLLGLHCTYVIMCDVISS
jgi:hypothetical protein